jgi:anti-anti-sigma factor
MSEHMALPPGERACSECGTALPAGSATTTLHVGTAGDRLTVTVSGELDLDSDQLLRQTLGDALDRATGGVELDLSGVTFCDCSALNVLLDVHHRARERSKSLVLRASSPAVDRLLSLTGTLPLFTAPPAPRPEPGRREALVTENAQLRQALQSHAAIDLARGMLMASFRMTPQQAWQVLVTTSQHSNTKMRLIADALLETSGGRALPASLAGHLASAVATHGTMHGTTHGTPHAAAHGTTRAATDGDRPGPRSVRASAGQEPVAGGSGAPVSSAGSSSRSPSA